ncbi:MAG: electron transport complex subunit RsxG [Gallionella sp.]|nr:electron transport complex subunit RsxG [Gallionella sp.]
MARASLHTALNLLFFALVGTAMLALTYELTRTPIAQSEEREKLKLISQIVPASAYDNDILQDTEQRASNELLGTRQSTPVYRGRLRGEPSIVVIEAIAPDGYSGKIHLIVAIHRDGRLGGVRVVSHKETPGLGDYIEIAKSNWITGFDDLSLSGRKDGDWKVKKDGGTFDYVAGATITPRAIVKAVHKTLRYAERHHDELFAPTAPAAKEEAK